MCRCGLCDSVVSLGTDGGHSSGGAIPSAPTLLGVRFSGSAMSSGNVASFDSPVLISCLQFLL